MNIYIVHWFTKHIILIIHKSSSFITFVKLNILEIKCSVFDNETEFRVGSHTRRTDGSWVVRVAIVVTCACVSSTERKEESWGRAGAQVRVLFGELRVCMYRRPIEQRGAGWCIARVHSDQLNKGSVDCSWSRINMTLGRCWPTIVEIWGDVVCSCSAWYLEALMMMWGYDGEIQWYNGDECWIMKSTARKIGVVVLPSK